MFYSIFQQSNPSLVPRIDSLYRELGWKSSTPPSMTPEKDLLDWLEKLEPSKKVFFKNNLETMSGIKLSEMHEQRLKEITSFKEGKKLILKLEDLMNGQENWMMGKEFTHLSKAHKENLTEFYKEMQAAICNRLIHRVISKFPILTKALRVEHHAWPLNPGTAKWVNDLCPIFFLSEKLQQALEKTSPPSIPFDIGSMKWPLESFTVILANPIACTFEGTVENIVDDVVAVTFARYPEGQQTFRSPEDRFARHLEWSVDPIHHELNLDGGNFVITLTPKSKVGMVTLYHNTARQTYLNAFCGTLLHVMTEKEGILERGAKIGEKRVQGIPTALWSPNYIGRTYLIRQERETGTGEVIGSRRRTHWRSGHWRYQRVGPRKSEKLTKHIWIEPILINGDHLIE